MKSLPSSSSKNLKITESSHIPMSFGYFIKVKIQSVNYSFVIYFEIWYTSIGKASGSCLIIWSLITRDVLVKTLMFTDWTCFRLHTGKKGKKKKFHPSIMTIKQYVNKMQCFTQHRTYIVILDIWINKYLCESTSTQFKPVFVPFPMGLFNTYPQQAILHYTS